MPYTRTVETCVYTPGDPKSGIECRNEIREAQGAHLSENCELEITGTEDHSVKKLTLLCEGRVAPETAAQRSSSRPISAAGQRVSE